MSYDYAERSTLSSKPIALFEFSIGSKNWFYAQSETAFSIPNPYGSNPARITYLPTAIYEEGITQTGIADAEDVHVHMPANLPVPQLFQGTPPSDPVFVTIRRGNVGQDEAPVYWIGTIKSSLPDGKLDADLTCAMLIASFKRQGLRLGWQRSCPYSLYDSKCKVNPAAWRSVIRIERVNGAAIAGSAIAGLQVDRFTGGFIEWTTDLGYIERRAIEAQLPEALVILEGTQGLKVGMTVNAYPGCKLTQASCKSYNNFANYGGFPMMPGKSPFDGSPVF